MRTTDLSQSRAALRSLGATIRVARRRLGVAQECLAAAADVDRAYLGRIGRGEVNVSFILLTRIADGFKTSVGELLASRPKAILRALRNEAGYSQDELASAAGVHRTYISGLERGERNVTIDSVEKIAAALHTDVGRLFA